MNQPAKRQRKPDWLRARSASGNALHQVKTLLRDLKLSTVCEEAGCPNCGECFNEHTATFLILGPVCSRSCRFCQVKTGRPLAVDANEPQQVAQAVQRLRLRHVVITSVSRDDLEDGGASQFAACLEAIAATCDEAVTTEVLVPDFGGHEDALQRVIQAGPTVLNHNIETVPRLYEKVRPEAVYERSLQLLARAKKLAPDLLTKSGLMLGLGEKEAEVMAVLQDLRRAGCDMLTLGQYLSPSTRHLPVSEYVHPDRFEAYKHQALSLGFSFVASGPLVRSSYQAHTGVSALLQQKGGS